MDVFIDLEAFGFGVVKNESRHLRGLIKYLDTLLPSLQQKGYMPKTVVGVACSWRRRRGNLPHTLLSAVHRVFRERGASMVWCETIADTELMTQVRLRCHEKSLQKHVFLLTNDGDFVPLVQELRNNGHVVICSGTAMSGKLVKTANQAIRFQELCSALRK